MKFLPSKKITHTGGLCWLILTIRKPLKEIVIASLTSEIDIKKILSKKNTSYFGKK